MRADLNGTGSPYRWSRRFPVTHYNIALPGKFAYQFRNHLIVLHHGSRCQHLFEHRRYPLDE